MLVGMNPISIAGLPIPYRGGQREKAVTSDKAGCARWQDDSAGCIMPSNFLWKMESNRRYDFGLGNFAGIERYPHCIFINKIKLIGYKFDSVPAPFFLNGVNSLQAGFSVRRLCRA
ncbi:hypothetical protein [Aurantimonas sp. A3-2-R12]|uniref:hypothetical protein n=1 Tax=Aurantimonas sp. A3-2-R12 TaxID=3114362 RepID=UPI002E1969D8|nr:hypothetical protein [Aurantimonas sp. A3-2-R12]